MGILVLGIGIGGLATFGALLHVLNNGLTKVALFLSAGNIQHAYASKSSEDITGVIAGCLLRAFLFMAGFLAITGSPPFGLFLSEFTIVDRGPWRAVNSRRRPVPAAFGHCVYRHGSNNLAGSPGQPP